MWVGGEAGRFPRAQGTRKADVVTSGKMYRPLPRGAVESPEQAALALGATPRSVGIGRLLWWLPR